jgi:hypothetical protein
MAGDRRTPGPGSSRGAPRGRDADEAPARHRVRGGGGRFARGRRARAGVTGQEADDLPLTLQAVILAAPRDDPVVVWWRENYAAVVATARGGAPTALAITAGWARAEVEHARKHGAKPLLGVPLHE